MLNKLCTSVPRIACLLFFTLVLASSTSANPFYKSDDSLPVSKKVVDFNVHISESGEEYNETIEVDTEKQTELFQVPAHPGVDRSDVLNDFKQKLTMLRIPDNKECYLMPLPKEQSTPEKLIRDLEKAEQEVITTSRRIDSTWIIKEELTERSFLSEELQQFCTDYPIFLVKKAQDSLTPTRIQTEAKRKRRKMNDRCPGGMGQQEARQKCNKPDLKCKVWRTVCYKYVICSVGGPVEPPAPATFASRSLGGVQQPCWQDHIYRNIDCCEYICQ